MNEWKQMNETKWEWVKGETKKSIHVIGRIIYYKYKFEK